MERRDYVAGVERSRDWMNGLCEAAYAVSLILVGAAAGISLCKFWPEFWWFVNWGMSV